MNFEDFKKYNTLRTNLLYKYTHSEEFLNKHLDLNKFLSAWENSKSIFIASIIEGSGTIAESTWNRYNDTIPNWKTNSILKRTFNNMFPEINYEYLDEVVQGFNPLSIEEFSLISKGKYYLGQDLDEDLGGMMNYVKEDTLFKQYLTELEDYFQFRYDNYNLSLLGEFYSVPFGIHEKRSLQYKKTGVLEFEYPREYYRYPIKEWFESDYVAQEHKGTRIINIRGTNGSGKSTMVNQFYTSSQDKETIKYSSYDKDGKIHDRYYDILKDYNIVLLGGYNTPFGTKGCDRLADVYEICHSIIKVVNEYPGWTIIMESATVSTCFWSYSMLFLLLKNRGVEINIVHLLMNDWEFCANNIKNRTVRKEGQKEPDYQEIKDKKYMLYKNHFRFKCILNKDYLLYVDTIPLEQKAQGLNNLIVENGGIPLW